MKTKLYCGLLVLSLFAICGLYYLGGHDIDRELADESRHANTKNEVTIETNVVGDNETNGLPVFSDVGGTVSFQQSSSKTSAPVAPENPHLK
jgi:hypothetical protein